MYIVEDIASLRCQKMKNIYMSNIQINFEL